jgi:hypothetical protein
MFNQMAIYPLTRRCDQYEGSFVSAVPSKGYGKCVMREAVGL